MCRVLRVTSLGSNPEAAIDTAPVSTPASLALLQLCNPDLIYLGGLLRLILQKE